MKEVWRAGGQRTELGARWKRCSICGASHESDESVGISRAPEGSLAARQLLLRRHLEATADVDEVRVHPRHQSERAHLDSRQSSMRPCESTNGAVVLPAMVAGVIRDRQRCVLERAS